MRRLSRQRRRLVVFSSSVAAMSGLGPIFSLHHPVMRWVWPGIVAGLLVGVIAQMVKLRRDEGCA